MIELILQLLALICCLWLFLINEISADTLMICVFLSFVANRIEELRGKQ